MSFVRTDRWRWQHSLLLAGLNAVYVQVFLDPRLSVDAFIRFPPWLSTLGFAQPFFARPGGPGEYLSAWLAQGLTQPYLGALILTAVAAGLCLGLGRVLSALSGRPPSWIALLPATGILVMYAWFGFRLADLLALGLAVGAAAGYSRLLAHRPAWRMSVFVGASVLLYYLIGGVFALFVILCAILEAASGAGLLAGLAYLIFGAAPPLVMSVLLPSLQTAVAVARNTPADRLLSPFEAALLGLLWGFVVAAAALTALRARSSDAHGANWLQQRPILRLALIVAVLVAPVAATTRPVLVSMWRVEFLERHGLHEEALRYARALRGVEPQIHLCHSLNLALFHSGRMSDEMFSYPQIPDGLVMGMVCGPGVSDAVVREVRDIHTTDCSAVLFELGLLNQAAHELSEALEWHGPQPLTLKLLVDVYLAKNQAETARRFLSVLVESPRARAWARGRLAELDSTGQVREERIDSAARNQLRKDTYVSDIQLEPQCLALLQANPHNRMAYEYLMNMYLLNRRLDRFIVHLEQLGQVGFTAVPRHWQEAIVLWEVQSGKTVGLSGYRMDSAVYAQFAQFSDLMAPLQRAGASPEALVRAAGPQFGNTYFYYYVTTRSGEGTL